MPGTVAEQSGPPKSRPSSIVAPQIAPGARRIRSCGFDVHTRLQQLLKSLNICDKKGHGSPRGGCKSKWSNEHSAVCRSSFGEENSTRPRSILERPLFPMSRCSAHRPPKTPKAAPLEPFGDDGSSEPPKL